MPLVPVPRWQPFTRYTVTRSFLDALPAGWALPELGHLAFYIPFRTLQGQIGPTTGASSYQGCLTPREEAAGCITYYGPAGRVGIWEPVPRAQWATLNSSQLHLVRAHQVNSVRLEGWQYPGFWEEVMEARTIAGTRQTVRVDWDTSITQELGAIQRPARTLEQVFEDAGVAYDYRELPVLRVSVANEFDFKTIEERVERNITASSGVTGYARIKAFIRAQGLDIKQLRLAAKQELYEEAVAVARLRAVQDIIALAKNERRKLDEQSTFQALAPPGPLVEGIGYPQAVPDLLRLVAGTGATVGAMGETCFECEQRDTYVMFKHIRSGPPQPVTAQQSTDMETLITNLIAQGL